MIRNLTKHRHLYRARVCMTSGCKGFRVPTKAGRTCPHCLQIMKTARPEDSKP